MRIENVYIKPVDDGRVEVGATYDGQGFCYRLPAERLCRQAVGDAIMLSALAPAMLAGSTLEMPDEYPVSSVLLSNLSTIQRIWAGWNPRLSQVAVKAAQYEPGNPGEGAGLFYAGGVDSTYSLSALRDEIDSLICCYGFDFAFTPEEIAESVGRNEAFAERLDKTLVPVETTHSAFVISMGVSRQFVFGLTLACVGLLLGLKRCHIASSWTINDLQPYGSHFFVDVLFSNGITRIIHDDVSVSRLEKTWAIARDPVLLENLRVCWNSHDSNCGHCSKCVRTMAALRLIGVDGPFPPLRNMKQIREMASTSPKLFVVELIVAAHRNGDGELLRELKKGMRTNDWRTAVQYLDRAFFGGRIRSLYGAFAYSSERELIKWNLRPDLEIS